MTGIDSKLGGAATQQPGRLDIERKFDLIHVE